MESKLMHFLYASAVGRGFVKLLLTLGLPRVLASFLRSPLSKPLIPRYIRFRSIPMEDYPPQKYHSFAEFFARKKAVSVSDPEPSHFISPCDGYLSAYPICDDSSFSIKGSHYRLSDLVENHEEAKKLRGGLCLIFRLAASDYHHYAFVDDGRIGEHHYIEGKLHSVQPIACSKLPVYRLNRRCWSLLDTENFGKIVQVEIGALAVGGIVNEYEKSPVSKGEVMGHFELCGSTVVLMLRDNEVTLLPEIQAVLNSGKEYRVTQGMWIASKAERPSEALS